MGSLMTARPHLSGRCLVAYSDIVFDRQILEQLLTSPYPITLVIDRAYQGLPHRDKELDLVQVEDPAEGEKARRLSLNTLKPVKRIGKKMDRAAAHCEFVGIAYFQESGMEALLKAWDDAQKEFQGRPFYEAPGLALASLNDLLQYMIDRGTPVYGMEIEHGWTEVHSLEDYQRLNEYFKTPGVPAACKER